MENKYKKTLAKIAAIFSIIAVFSFGIVDKGYAQGKNQQNNIAAQGLEDEEDTGGENLDASDSSVEGATDKYSADISLDDVNLTGDRMESEIISSNQFTKGGTRVDFPLTPEKSAAQADAAERLEKPLALDPEHKKNILNEWRAKNREKIEIAEKERDELNSKIEKLTEERENSKFNFFERRKQSHEINALKEKLVKTEKVLKEELIKSGLSGQSTKQNPAISGEAAKNVSQVPASPNSAGGGRLVQKKFLLQQIVQGV